MAVTTGTAGTAGTAGTTGERSLPLTTVNETHLLSYPVHEYSAPLMQTADFAHYLLKTFDNFPNTQWQVLLQQFDFWHITCPRTFLYDYVTIMMM